MGSRVSFRDPRPEAKCWACRRNRHVNCSAHLNDGAVDAEDFVTVGCDCPCEGDVHEADRGLIGLVADLRASLVQLGREATEREATLTAQLAEARSTIHAQHEALATRYDDEGNRVSPGP